MVGASAPTNPRIRKNIRPLSTSLLAIWSFHATRRYIGRSTLIACGAFSGFLAETKPTVSNTERLLFALGIFLWHSKRGRLNRFGFNLGYCGGHMPRITKHVFSVAATMLLLTTSLNAPAAAQLRLHSASEEEITQRLVDELDKARAAHLAAIDAHRAYLVDALSRERKLLTEREIAERDAFLTIILAKRVIGPSQADALSEQIAADWKELTGSRGTAKERLSFANGARLLRAAELERNALLRDRDTLIVEFEARGGKGSYCDTAGSGDVEFETLRTSLEAQGIQSSCDDLKTVTTTLGRYYKLGGSASSLLGDPDGLTAGAIGEALSEAQNLKALLTAQKSLSKAVATQTKSLDAYYQCELNRPTAADSIRSDVAAVQDALDMLANGDPTDVFAPATFNQVWKTLTTQPVDPDCRKDAPGATAPTAKDADPAKILPLIGKLDKYFAKDALLAAVRETALNVQGSALNDALNGLATEAEVPDSKSARHAAAALRIFGNLDTIYRGGKGTLPDVSGVLVALADVRMRQATAKIEADRIAELDRLNKLRVAALRQRAIFLADAEFALAPKSDEAVMIALRHYRDSWNMGAVPAIVIRNDMVKSRYLPWVDREKAVVEAGYAVLAPAAAQLSAYGKGGLKPETIAEFLQALGLGAIAVK